MNSQTIWYSTFHEIRTLRRLLRTHVFIWIALFICTVYFLVVTLTHMYDAGKIPMLGVISPRYIMSLLSGSFIALFCIGVLLLTFDQVKRDELTRIHEVMSSKPANNLEVFTGRLLGISITITIPMLFFLFSIVTYGMVADMFSLEFGEPVELWSVVSFTFLDIFPNFLFFRKFGNPLFNVVQIAIASNSPHTLWTRRAFLAQQPAAPRHLQTIADGIRQRTLPF